MPTYTPNGNNFESSKATLPLFLRNSGFLFEVWKNCHLPWWHVIIFLICLLFKSWVDILDKYVIGTVFLCIAKMAPLWQKFPEPFHPTCCQKMTNILVHGVAFLGGGGVQKGFQKVCMLLNKKWVLGGGSPPLHEQLWPIPSCYVPPQKNRKIRKKVDPPPIVWLLAHVWWPWREKKQKKDMKTTALDLCVAKKKVPFNKIAKFFFKLL